LKDEGKYFDISIQYSTFGVQKRECLISNDEGKYFIIMSKYDLEERLIDFAVTIIQMADQIPKTLAGRHLANQIVRSGTSPALNYGEAQSGESRKDFVHKMKICLKELRETYINLKILFKAKLFVSEREIETLLTENNELISIFVKSIKTAEKKGISNVEW
jgi:four helix bundle protein